MSSGLTLYLRALCACAQGMIGVLLEGWPLYSEESKMPSDVGEDKGQK